MKEERTRTARLCNYLSDRYWIYVMETSVKLMMQTKKELKRERVTREEIEEENEKIQKFWTHNNLLKSRYRDLVYCNWNT